MTLNSVQLIGAVAHPPVFLQRSKTDFYRVTLAGTAPVLTATGLRQLPFYHDVVCFGAAAQAQAAKDLKQGQVTAVQGKLNYREWHSPHHGERREVNVLAYDLIPLHTPPGPLIEEGGGALRLAEGGLNEVMVSGTVASSSLRQLTQGPVCDLTLHSLDSGGYRHILPVTLWHNLAEYAQELREGHEVLVRGRLANSTLRSATQIHSKIECNFIERAGPSSDLPVIPHEEAYP